MICRSAFSSSKRLTRLARARNMAFPFRPPVAMTFSHRGHQGGSSDQDSQKNTKPSATAVPARTIYSGLAGTLPFLGTSLITVTLAQDAALATAGTPTLTGMDLASAVSALHTFENVQIAYGFLLLCVILQWASPRPPQPSDFWLYGQPGNFRKSYPPWFPTFRAYFSSMVGFSIAITLAGTWYYGFPIARFLSRRSQTSNR